MLLYFLDLILLWPVIYFRDIKPKKLWNQVSNWAFTPTNGPRDQQKSFAAPTQSIRPVCTCIKIVWSLSGKNLQRRQRFNSAISFQLDWSLSYKYAQRPRVRGAPFWPPFPCLFHLFHFVSTNPSHRPISKAV
jgi:hypothetical protein